MGGEKASTFLKHLRSKKGMAISSKQEFKLKKLLKELSEHKGRGTELVSVYVPAGYDLNKIINHLQDEQGTASNIKSKQTRDNVIDALEKMIQHLKLYKKTPPNGLALFSGNVAEREGQSDIEVWSIEPPMEMNQRLYRCDKEFVLEPLWDMAEEKNIYGLVALDKRDAIIALLKGKTIEVLLKTHSEVPGKFRAGGQSAQRFERLREGAAKDHYRKVAEYMKEQFLQMEDLKGIIVGGPGPTKHDFIEKGHITDQVKQKIIGVKDLSYTEEFGLQELVDKSQDLLASEEIAEEKELMQKFLTYLKTNAGMVSYGRQDVERSLQLGAVDTLLLSEDLDDAVIDALSEQAAQFSSAVQIISTETREGVQLRDMGKVAAILRYELQ